MTDVEIRPRPRIAVAAFMLALHMPHACLAREQWLVELLELAMYRTWRNWS